ncbi:Hypothetical predicted protein [Paramuricea clavata]|uniref:Uncharacterized protein n=1 Tax=Paramuricea clavata TaxID=317549 RepID=A0A7D9HI33_PARCT|nr:Hypothetical predicted protein [Paramuricea clavata]
MAKSIRSKAKRKLRAVKREKIAAKERLKLLAIQEEEEGIKMIQDVVESGDKGEKIPASSGDVDETMDAVSENQSVIKAKKKKPKKTSKSGSGKNVKRLKKKRKNKYKW